MLLAGHGWGLADLDRARPDRLAAARWALFAERVSPMLSHAEEVLATEFHRGMSASEKSRLAKGKLAAKDQVAQIRSALFPDDE